MDGTLVNSQEQLSARNLAAIKAVQASGTPFVLVTGRPPMFIVDLVRGAGLDGYAVCSNGAVTYDINRDQVLYAASISGPRILRIITRIQSAIPGARFGAERVGKSAVHPEFSEFLAGPGYVHPWTGDNPRHVTVSELIANPCVKLLVRDQSQPSVALAAQAKAAVGELAEVTFSYDDGLIEVSGSGDTKATGLAKIAHSYGVRADAVLAFGDMPNDIPMFMWVGHAVAMANAHPELKAIANEITMSNNEDGVAQVLERWF